MITEQDLVEAIAECQGQRNPNANTCIKLAAYYTILNNIKEKPSAQEESKEVERLPVYSYSAGNVIEYEGESQFAKAINGKTTEEIIPLIDELMQTLQVVNPPLYKSVMRRI